MSARPLFAVLSLAAFACARLTLPGWDPERSMLSVRLGGITRSDAHARTVAAFAAEGQTIQAADATAGFIVTTETGRSLLLYTQRFTYRATVVQAGDSVEVLLSGSSYNVTGQTHTATLPLSPNDATFLVLARVAARLRGEPPPDSLSQVTRPLRP